MEDNAATRLNHIHGGFIDEVRLEIRIYNRLVGIEAVPTKEVQFAPLFIASPSIIALFHLFVDEYMIVRISSSQLAIEEVRCYELNVRIDGRCNRKTRSSIQQASTIVNLVVSYRLILIMLSITILVLLV